MEGLRDSRPNFTAWQRWRFNRVIHELASNKCLAVIPISESAARAQRLVLHWAQSEQAEKIAAKMIVLHPPQSALITFTEKSALAREPLHFMFVGHDFFRKGGLEMLEAFIQFRERTKARLQLTLVSALRTGDYATHAGKADFKKAQHLIRANSAWVTHYLHLPHQ